MYHTAWPWRLPVLRYNDGMTTTPSLIDFDAIAQVVNGELIMRLPEAASKQLPSRGQVAAIVRVGDDEVQTVVEPDGNGGHWLRIDTALRQAGMTAGHRIAVTVTPTKVWPEPVVPDDLAEALARATEPVRAKWQDITPMARWEWVRWVNATASASTRAVRIDKTISKLAGTHRRPCCFNLSACTDPAVSKSGRLIEG